MKVVAANKPVVVSAGTITLAKKMPGFMGIPRVTGEETLEARMITAMVAFMIANGDLDHKVEPASIMNMKNALVKNKSKVLASLASVAETYTKMRLHGVKEQ